MPLPTAPHEAAEIAEAIDRDDGGFFEGGGEKSAGKMGAMVFNVVDADLVASGNAGRGEGVGQVGHFDAVASTGDETRPISRADSDASHFPPELRLWVPGNGDMAERGWIDLSQASLGGQGGKTSPVFDAVKAFLFHSGRELAVGEEGGRSVAVEGVKA